jgi:pyruvate dehydrogenase E1 component
MLAEQVDEYYYLTLMNENYTHPDMPAGACAEGIIKGMYLLKDAGKPKKGELRVQLLGSGTILRESVAAATMLRAEWGVESDLWSCPSFNELARDGMDAERWSRLHPSEKPRRSHVETCLADTRGPVIASTDHVRLFAEQIRPYLPVGRRYAVLGTDGFGRSDTREQLRHFFEVDRYWITITALTALADEGQIERGKVAEAIAKYSLNAEKPNPTKV